MYAIENSQFILIQPIHMNTHMGLPSSDSKCVRNPFETIKPAFRFCISYSNDSGRFSNTKIFGKVPNDKKTRHKSGFG